MNKTLRIFLCAILATSPILAMKANEQSTEKGVKAFIQRHWALGATAVSGTIAGLSLWQMVGHMAALYNADAECTKKFDNLNGVILNACNAQAEGTKKLVCLARLIRSTSAEYQAAIDKRLLLTEKHMKSFDFWMIVAGMSTIAAILLYDSWKSEITKSTEDKEANTELPAPCYYE